MVDGRREYRTIVKTACSARVFGHLQDHFSVECLVGGQVNDLHTALSDLAKHGVTVRNRSYRRATEPLGRRIIDFAETRERSESRNTRAGAGFVAYVPVASVKIGEDLVTTGGARIVGGKIVAGKTMACGMCHGADLKGLPNVPGTGISVPGLVGLHPVYVVRQLYDMQHGTRIGATVALMQPAISNLTIDDMINIAAYIASLNPGGADLRPKRTTRATH